MMSFSQFSFGPLVMRLLYDMKETQKALDLFNDPVIIMCLLVYWFAHVHTHTHTHTHNHTPAFVHGFNMPSSTLDNIVNHYIF